MIKEPKVLIVEDDPDQVLMYSIEFEAHGYIVRTAETGLEGLRLAKEETPDVIMLDILMEKMDGLETMAELKKDPKTKDIPIVVFTNYGKEEFEGEAKRLGAAKFIMKTSRVPRQIVEDVSSLIGVTPAKHTGAAHRSEKILMIEDNPFHRHMYATKFSRSGFTLITAVNGEEGLKQAREGNIDVILLDLALPGISGVDVLKELKKDERTSSIPVIAFTVTPKEDLPDGVKQYVRGNTVGYFEKLTQLPNEAVTIVERVLQERTK